MNSFPPGAAPGGGVVDPTIVIITSAGGGVAGTIRFLSLAILIGDLMSNAHRGFAITPHDSNALPYETRGLYVGGAGGDVSVVFPNGDIVLFTAVPAGSLLPIAAIRVRSTGTTATGIVGLY